MAQQRNPDVYPSTTAGEGSGNKQLAATVPGTADDTTLCDFGTTTTAGYIQAKALLSNTTRATPVDGQNAGWNVLLADMARIPTTKKTRIPAGVWTFQCELFGGGGATTPTAAVQARVHRRTTAGVLTGLFTTESAATTPPVVAAAYPVNWSSASQPEFLLANGDTIQVEYWINSNGIVVIGNIVKFRVGGGTTTDRPQVAVPTGFTDLTLTTVAATSSIARTIQRTIKTTKAATTTAAAGFTRRLTLRRTLAATATWGGSLRKLIRTHPLPAVATWVGDVLIRLPVRKLPPGGRTFVVSRQFATPARTLATVQARQIRFSVRPTAATVRATATVKVVVVRAWDPFATPGVFFGF